MGGKNKIKVIIHYLDSKEMQAFFRRLEKCGYKVFKKGNLQASRIFSDVNKRAHVLIQQKHDGCEASVHIDSISNNLHKIIVDEKLLKIIARDLFWNGKELKKMQILTFSKIWKEFSKKEFTTFRFPRRDKDWEVEELVKIVYKQRSKKERRELGIAEIINKEPKMILEDVSGLEAKRDGFQSISDVALNKLSLQWVERWCI